MQSSLTHFQFAYNLAMIEADKETKGNKEIYTLHFSNEIPSLKIISVALSDGSYQWDSVPAGNTELACSLGKLIEEYYKKQKET